MVMLVLLTLVTLSSVNLSTSNVKATANMQFRDAAFAAANVAIEQVVSTDFNNAPGPVTVYLDMDQDGTNDYRVGVPEPHCDSWEETVPDITKPEDEPCFLGARSGGGSFCAETSWRVRAQVVDLATDTQAADAATGAAVTVNQGIRVRMSRPLARNACD
jgi:hypothetical protein